MSRFRIIVVFCLFGFALSGCVTAAATLAMSAVSLATGGGGGGGKQSPFKNPVDKHSTGRQVRDALSRLNDKVDPACQQLLDQHRESEPMSASAASSAMANAPDIAPPAAAKATKDSDDAPAPETVQKASAKQATVKGDGIGGGPGICRHRLVCLPGTPKPTMMLMCPGRNSAGTGADNAEKTVISSEKPATAPVAASADKPVEGEKTVISSGTPAAAPVAPSADKPEEDGKTVVSSGTPAAAPVAPSADKPEEDEKTVVSSGTPAAALGAPTADKPAEVDKTAVSSNKPDPTPVKPSVEKPARGGVADWDWSQDPSHRL